MCKINDQMYVKYVFYCETRVHIYNPNTHGVCLSRLDYRIRTYVKPINFKFEL